MSAHTNRSEPFEHEIAGQPLERDVRHDVFHAASTVQMLVNTIHVSDDDDTLRGALAGIEQCAREITALMRAGRQTAPQETSDLASLASQLGDRSRLVFSGTLDVHIEPASVRASELDVVRILSNVIDNAIRAAQPDGTVQLRVGTHDSSGVITVADSGSGTSTDPSTAGGMGLSIVATIVMRLNGELRFGPSALGGELVTITLPSAEDEAPFAEAATNGARP